MKTQTQKTITKKNGVTTTKVEKVKSSLLKDPVINKNYKNVKSKVFAAATPAKAGEKAQPQETEAKEEAKDPSGVKSPDAKSSTNQKSPSDRRARSDRGSPKNDSIKKRYGTASVTQVNNNNFAKQTKSSFVRKTDTQKNAPNAQTAQANNSTIEKVETKPQTKLEKKRAEKKASQVKARSPQPVKDKVMGASKMNGTNRLPAKFAKVARVSDIKSRYASNQVQNPVVETKAKVEKSQTMKGDKGFYATMQLSKSSTVKSSTKARSPTARSSKGLEVDLSNK